MIEADRPRVVRSAAVRRRSRHRKYESPRHKLTRKFFAPSVAAGLELCRRCHQPIEPGTPWDLGHDDHNPLVHTGPEHAVCNRGAPHRNVTSREW